MRDGDLVIFSRQPLEVNIRMKPKYTECLAMQVQIEHSLLDWVKHTSLPTWRVNVRISDSSRCVQDSIMVAQTTGPAA
jgi:hypothetical protein